MILLLTMYNTWGPKWMAMPLPLKRKSVNVRVLCSSLAKCRLPSWGKNTQVGQLDSVDTPILFISQLPCQHQYEWSSCKWKYCKIRKWFIFRWINFWKQSSWFYFSPASTRLNLNSADAVGRNDNCGAVKKKTGIPPSCVVTGQVKVTLVTFVWLFSTCVFSDVKTVIPPSCVVRGQRCGSALN